MRAATAMAVVYENKGRKFKGFSSHASRHCGTCLWHFQRKVDPNCAVFCFVLIVPVPFLVLEPAGCHHINLSGLICNQAVQRYLLAFVAVDGFEVSLSQLFTGPALTMSLALSLRPDLTTVTDINYLTPRARLRSFMRSCPSVNHDFQETVPVWQGRRMRVRFA